MSRVYYLAVYDDEPEHPYWVSVAATDKEHLALSDWCDEYSSQAFYSFLQAGRSKMGSVTRLYTSYRFYNRADAMRFVYIVTDQTSIT